MDERVSKSTPGTIRLREVLVDDLAVFFEQQRDPEANRMAAFPARDRPAFYAHWARVLADKTLLKWTILVDGQVAGYLGCYDQEGVPEVGYWLGREFWGRGIATAALQQFLTLVPARPLYAHVASHNHASRRVLEKCGFRLVRTEGGVSNPNDEQPDELLLVIQAEPAQSRQ